MAATSLRGGHEFKINSIYQLNFYTLLNISTQ